LRTYEEKRLRAIVRYAYENVQFYHEKLREAKILPSDIKSVEDLSKLPITSKDEIRNESVSKIVSKAFDPSRLKMKRTTGSTGKPFQILVTSKEDDWRKSIYMRANISCGQKVRDKWIVVTAPHHFSDTTPFQRKLGLFAQTCVSIHDDISHQIEIVKAAKPDILDGYSGWLLALAQQVKKTGENGISPRIMFGSAEFIDKSSMAYLEDTFGSPYYDQFGCAEVDRTAWMCPNRDGYHMDIDSVITEFVSKDGEAVASGERGNIVYTSLFNYAMPLIRYGVGDVGVPSTEKCSCGRSLPLMKVIEGRKDSLLVLPNGRILSPVAFFTTMYDYEYYSEIEQFKLVQKKIDVFEMFIKKKDDKIDESVFRDSMTNHVAKVLAVKPGTVSIDVEFVTQIPAIGDKHASVVSEMKI
jgi:phenylacetate-CoA ligase